MSGQSRVCVKYEYAYIHSRVPKDKRQSGRLSISEGMDPARVCQHTS